MWALFHKRKITSSQIILYAPWQSWWLDFDLFYSARNIKYSLQIASGEDHSRINIVIARSEATW